MTEVLKGCPFAGCNAPESECSGACMRNKEEEEEVALALRAMQFGKFNIIEDPTVPEGEEWLEHRGKVVYRLTGLTDMLAKPTPQRAAPEREDSPLMCELLGFLNDLTHPEQYGHAVTAEVRKRARELATAIETAEGML